MFNAKTLALVPVAAAALMAALPQAASAAPKCRTGDSITTINNRIYCVSRSQRPKCGSARYMVDYQGNKDMCVVYRRNGSVKKTAATKCGFLGTGAGWQYVRGTDRCLYTPNAFRR